MWSILSLPSLPGPLWPGVVALPIGQIELSCILKLNWIVWNRTVFDIETLLMLNWIILNRTVLTFNCVQTKTILTLNCLN